MLKGTPSKNAKASEWKRYAQGQSHKECINAAVQMCNCVNQQQHQEIDMCVLLHVLTIVC